MYRCCSDCVSLVSFCVSFVTGYIARNSEGVDIAHTGDQPDSEDINTTFPRFDFYFDEFAYL